MSLKYFQNLMLKKRLAITRNLVNLGDEQCSDRPTGEYKNLSPILQAA